MPWRPTSIHATSRVEDDTMETRWLGQAIVLVLSPAGLTTCTVTLQTCFTNSAGRSDRPRGGLLPHGRLCRHSSTATGSLPGRSGFLLRPADQGAGAKIRRLSNGLVSALFRV